jgi:ubiquinone/menaquinone biosynthesis C-methylase UbiE
MNYLKKIKHFNNKASSSKFKPNEILTSLELKKNIKIADIGAGGGYFTFEFSKIVGNEGKVFSIDIVQEYLDYIKNYSMENNLTNIETLLADEIDNKIQPESVDMLFTRNNFHHIEKPVEYFQELIKYLKPDGRIAIIDYIKKGFNYTSLFGHHTPKEKIIDSMEKIGFLVEREHNFLTRQSFFIFKRK